MRFEVTPNSTNLLKPQTGRDPSSPRAPALTTALFSRHRNVLVPIFALIVLVAYFGAQNSAFISTGSGQNILRQMAFLSVLALAGTFVILIGGIDLSVAANATLAGILIAKLLDPLGGPLAVIVVLLIGGLVGLLNGVIATLLKVPSFLVTLGMMSVLDGVSNTISKGGPVSYNSGLLNTLVNTSGIPGLPNGALIALVLTVAFTVLVFATSYGRHLYAVGGNERAARLSGVRVRTVKLSVFMLAGVIAAVAGIILTGQASTGVPLGADPSLLNSIAAIVVGGTALSGGVGGPHRTLLGTLVIVILGSGMDITSVGPYTQLIVKGAVVILAVAITIDRKRYGLIK
ncbi:ABC transporter permease [Actinomadura scrupuli]|uniref:ABC transporter permease n=1 Tax=Actinomadura scrupuli TaxID=559629 RepID=UPI003D974E57